MGREETALKRFCHLTPRYVWNRLKAALHERWSPDLPWLTCDAVFILSTMLRPSDVGLEWGSGRSTIWLAERVKRLTSMEHDPGWHEMVSHGLAEAGISNVEYVFCDTECELPETYKYLDKIEVFLNKPITRIKPYKSFDHLSLLFFY